MDIRNFYFEFFLEMTDLNNDPKRCPWSSVRLRCVIHICKNQTTHKLTQMERLQRKKSVDSQSKRRGIHIRKTRPT